MRFLDSYELQMSHKSAGNRSKLMDPCGHTTRKKCSRYLSLGQHPLLPRAIIVESGQIKRQPIFILATPSVTFHHTLLMSISASLEWISTFCVSLLVCKPTMGGLFLKYMLCVCNNLPFICPTNGCWPADWLQFAMSKHKVMGSPNDIWIYVDLLGSYVYWSKGGCYIEGVNYKSITPDLW